MRAQQLWCMGLAAPWHVGSSSTRDQTLVPCIGRKILLHCTTRAVPIIFLLQQGFDSEWSHGLLVRTSGSQSPHGPVARPCSSSCSVQPAFFIILCPVASPEPEPLSLPLLPALVPVGLIISVCRLIWTQPTRRDPEQYCPDLGRDRYSDFEPWVQLNFTMLLFSAADCFSCFNWADITIHSRCFHLGSPELKWSPTWSKFFLPASLLPSLLLSPALKPQVRGLAPRPRKQSP